MPTFAGMSSENYNVEYRFVGMIIDPVVLYRTLVVVWTVSFAMIGLAYCRILTLIVELRDYKRAVQEKDDRQAVQEKDEAVQEALVRVLFDGGLANPFAFSRILGGPWCFLNYAAFALVFWLGNIAILHLAADPNYARFAQFWWLAPFFAGLWCSFWVIELTRVIFHTMNKLPEWQGTALKYYHLRWWRIFGFVCSVLAGYLVSVFWFGRYAPDFGDNGLMYAAWLLAGLFIILAYNFRRFLRLREYFKCLEQVYGKTRLEVTRILPDANTSTEESCTYNNRAIEVTHVWAVKKRIQFCCIQLHFDKEGRVNQAELQLAGQ